MKLKPFSFKLPGGTKGITIFGIKVVIPFPKKKKK